MRGTGGELKSGVQLLEPIKERYVVGCCIERWVEVVGGVVGMIMLCLRREAVFG